MAQSVALPPRSRTHVLWSWISHQRDSHSSAATCFVTTSSEVRSATRVLESASARDADRKYNEDEGTRLLACGRSAATLPLHAWVELKLILSSLVRRARSTHGYLRMSASLTWRGRRSRSHVGRATMPISVIAARVELPLRSSPRMKRSAAAQNLISDPPCRLSTSLCTKLVARHRTHIRPSIRWSLVL